MRRNNKKKPASLSIKNFSFLTHPEETLRSLRRIGELESTELHATLNFEDAHCMDAGSFLVLAEIWPKMAPVYAGGKMAKSIQKVLAATGVDKNNRMSMRAVGLGAEIQVDGKLADVWAFPLRRRRPAFSSRSETVHLDPQAREIAADRFCNAIDEWLGVPEIEQELTQSGRGWIASIIGELLCNAERHSQCNSNDGDWSITAFMVRRQEGGATALKCYIAFLSVGRSFSESLSDASPEIKSATERYVERHSIRGLSRATLATVFALQDTITCDPAARAERSGGTGLQDVLEFVEKLGGTGDAAKNSRVTIVSGSSCIALTADYIPGIRRDAKGDNEADLQPRLQWCNSQNASEYPPDEGVAFDLSEHFAGTLVSVAFTLDPDYLAAAVESGDDDDDQS